MICMFRRRQGGGKKGGLGMVVARTVAGGHGGPENRITQGPALPLFPLPAEMSPTTQKRPIAVIGAGFSGTMATLHLLRRLPSDQPVLLCERAPEFGRGVAFAPGDNEHLLNVRAANMSALADEPLHFQDWIQDRVAAGRVMDGLHKTSAGLFASRGLYGLYLRAILEQVMRESAGHARLRLLPDEVTDIAPAAGGGYTLVCASGQKLGAAGVVLAVGNLPAKEGDDPRICTYAWSDKARAPLASDLPVLIVGTGLTMVDIAVRLRRNAFKGGIIALSRGGLLPQRHAALKPWPTADISRAEETSLLALTIRVRREIRAAAAQGVDWRAVIDSMRPVTARLWQAMPLAERRRFLRHVRRYWDVHRHRMAPPHADLIDAMLADGSLTVTAGRIRRMEPGADAVRVTYAPRHGGGECRVEVQRVIMAAGLENMSGTRDPLLQRLLHRGLVRMDGQGMGIDVTDDLAVLQADGRPATNIWALGPIVRGVFWECIAVPDIRVQAGQVAASIAVRQREEAPSWSFVI
jgi:uncharacterized NAD(P)/FAD-binding protein YdhS